MNATIKRVVKDSPKNRKERSLPILHFEIEWEGGKWVGDPNQVAAMSVSGAYPIGLPVKGCFSLLSGKPAYWVREDNLEIALTLNELDRYVRHDLRGAEYERLLDHFGMFFSIHEDFYDPLDGGVAWQPREKGPLFKATVLRLKALTEKETLDKTLPTVPLRKAKKL